MSRMEPAGLVGESVLDIFARRDGAGGIVGIADVEDAAVGRGGEHGLDVVRVGCGERHLDDCRAVRNRGAHAGLVAGVGGDVGARGRGEGEHGELQRLRRAAVDVDVLGPEVVLLGEDLGELAGAGEVVTTGLVEHVGHGRACVVAGAERVLIGIDLHRAGRESLEGHASLGVGKLRLGEDGQRGCSSRGEHGVAEE